MSSILVLRALGLGDFLTGVPALRALRLAFPAARLVLAAPADLQPLASLSGVVDDLLPAAPLQPVDFDAPDIAVNLHGRGPESHRVLLRTAPRRLIAFANPEVRESAGFVGWRANEHEVDRWCRLLTGSGLPADPTCLRLPAPTVAAPAAAVGATLIHPGAASNARRWPAERWAEVARAELKAGRHVAVSAGPGEENLAHRVAGLAGLNPDHVVTGSLLEMAAAVAAARVVACADTGVAHLATAFGTPSVIIFGPTPPWLWGPPMWHPHIALWSGQRGDADGPVPDAGLLRIVSDDVTSALRQLAAVA